jgi:hypothetical protein
MPHPQSHRLRALIDDVCAATRGMTCARVATGWPSIDAALGGGVPCAGLHEWWGEPAAVCAVLVQLAWRVLIDDDRTHAGHHRHVAWVGRMAWPAGDELVRGMRAPLAGLFGGTRVRTWPDARLHDRSILVDVPAGDDGARLWAIEQAVRCGGVCAVIADGRALPMAATRRLQLAASGTMLCTLRGESRHAGDRARTPSAAATRWNVAPGAAPGAASGAATGVRHVPWLRAVHALAGRIPPEPCWRVTLERARGMAVDPCTGAADVAFARTQWEGTEEAPAPLVRAVARRTARLARLETERMRARQAALHGGGAAATAAVTTAAAAPPPARLQHPRARARDRMTSRGERWAQPIARPADDGRAA